MSAARTPQVLSVDVEEYFHVNAFDGHIPRERWSELPSRVEASIDRLLELMDRRRARATFFTLGWVAERHPDVPRKIAAAGHEVASHGWWHERVVTLTRDQFRREVSRSRNLLEDLTGGPVLGYRAPSFSILPRVDWAYDVLIEEGYVYDSSVFPIRRRDYGNPKACPRAHVVEREGGRLVELPMATTEVAGVRLPGAGGAYLRLLPFGLTRRTAREHESRGESGVFYVHPWEIDPDQPRFSVPWPSRVRQYGRLGSMYDRIDRLLGEFRFASISECYAEMLAGAKRPATSPDRPFAPPGRPPATSPPRVAG